MSANPSMGLRQRRQLHFGGGFTLAAAQPQGEHRDTRGPFSLTSLDTQPLSLGTLQGSDPPEEPGQMRCRSRGSVPEGRCPRGAVEAAPSTPHRRSWQHPPWKLSLAVASPWELQVFVAAALIHRSSPGRDIFPPAPAARSIPSLELLPPLCLLELLHSCCKCFNSGSLVSFPRSHLILVFTKEQELANRTIFVT